MINFNFFSRYLQTTDTNLISGCILQAKWRGIIEKLLQERDVIFSDDVLAVHACRRRRTCLRSLLSV